MRQLLSAVGVVLGLLASPLSAADLHCWDGTFNYNSASLVRTPHRFELTLAGNSLGPLRFHTHNGQVDVEEVQSALIYIPFKPGECSLSEDGLSGTCQMQFARDERSVYLSRTLDDLDNPVTLLASAYVEKVTMAFTVGQSMVVRIFDSRFLGGVKEQVTEVALQHCNDETLAPNSITKEFPQRLRDYLDARR